MTPDNFIHKSLPPIVVGIDNGTSGSIGIIGKDFTEFHKMPTKKEQSYTKAKNIITRVDYDGLLRLLPMWGKITVLLERPMVNPGRFRATLSAVRSLEATLIAIEASCLGYQYIDSKQWQKVMLPHGTKGTPALKKASVDVGCRLFPEHKDAIIKHKDADGLLIAEYYRWKYK